MGDLEPITRNEKLWSGEDLTPVTRKEMYIKHLYDETQVIPDHPVTREEMFILKAGEELHDVTIEQLTATENRTYSEEGVAYSPVIVNVPAPSVMSKNITENGDYSASDDNVYGYSSVHVAVPQTMLTTLDASANGTYTAPSGTAYSEVDVDVPLPENAYLLKEIEDVEIARFNDGSELSMQKLEVAIEPVQEGSGDPSPENIRPISGWDEVNVTRCGKNLFDKTAIENNKWLNISTGEIESSNGYAVTAPIKVEANKAITMTNPQSSRRWFYDNNGNAITLITSDTFTPSQDGYIRLTLALNNINLDTFQVEFGQNATAYEPYEGNTYTIDLDGTRYGGKVDVVSGVLTVDRAIKVFNGTENIENIIDGTPTTGQHNYFYYIISNENIAVTDDAICSHFEENSNITISNMELGFRYFYSATNHQTRIIFRMDETEQQTKEEFKAFLTSQYNANTPITVAYKLNTPLTIQLTPTLVKSLRGVNNVYADTGNILDLSYLAKEE